MIRYKCDIMALLKENGYNQTKIQREYILSGTVIMKLRNQQPVSMEILNKICILCKAQPGDLIEVVVTEEEKEKYNILF